MKVMATGLPGGTSFMEDYTYHFGSGGSLVLGAHMLEICPSISRERPSCEIHPLSIGGKADPVRLVFTASPGAAIAVGLLDLGHRFRLVLNEVDVVPPAGTLERLPVARAVWAPRPDLATAAETWLMAGGPHHTGFSQALRAEHLVRVRRDGGRRAAGHRQRHDRVGLQEGAALEPGLPPPGGGPLGRTAHRSARKARHTGWSRQPTAKEMSDGEEAPERSLARRPRAPRGSPARQRWQDRPGRTRRSHRQGLHPGRQGRRPDRRRERARTGVPRLRRRRHGRRGRLRQHLRGPQPGRDPGRDTGGQPRQRVSSTCTATTPATT